MDIISPNEQTAQHLWTISNRLSTICPAASRFYMFNLERKLSTDPKLFKDDVKRCYMYCNHCGSLWAPGNHKVRVQPPPPANRHIKTLLKKEAAEPWKLNNHQKKKLKKFRNSTSKIVYTCEICKKTMVFPGIKKYSKKEINQQPLNTFVPKIKRKKGELNAGLFIRTSEKNPQDERNLDCQVNSTISLTMPEAEIVPELTEPEDAKNSHSSEKLKFDSVPESAINLIQTKRSASVNVSNSQKLAGQKRKKNLFAQILNEEQCVKKKNIISSFLVSL